MLKFLSRLPLFFLLAYGTPLLAQRISWQATVTDSLSGEALVGVSIRSSEGRNSLSNTDGRFTLDIEQLPLSVRFSFVGYREKEVVLKTPFPDTILLSSSELSLNEVTVTANRQRQRIEEVTQSVEVVKPALLTHTQSNQVQEMMEKLPGVQVQKDQMTVRGGSGFSYGAGSRVMILLDEMPLLSADAGDAKWSYYPVENLEQIEVVKGPSSALYGSSALEGLVHLRTALAADTSYTQIRAFSGIYDKPKRRETAYWTDKNPLRYGLTLAHRRSAGPLKLTASLNGYKDEGYRQGDHDALLRGNLNVQYIPRKLNKLVIGFSLNGMQNKGEDFLLFGDTKQPYLPLQGTTTAFTYTRWHTDLSLKYYANSDRRHILRSRYFTTINNNSTNQSSTGRMLFNEYQYQDVLFRQGQVQTTFTTGLNYVFTETASPALYGNHHGHNAAAYMQVDQKIDRVIFNLGARLESNVVDTLEWAYFPVFRTGVNYRLGKATYTRFSLGQGFRYPSVAERFAETSSGAIRILPNDKLLPESGWGSEAGIRQLFKGRSVQAYADLSFFWSEYQNMIEYLFGYYPPPGRIGINYVGFSARNIAETRIRGLEVSGGFEKKWKKAYFDFYGGYTYVSPLDKNYDPVKDTIERMKYLKYRRQHLARANVDIGYGRLSLGIYTLYNSSIRNMDEIFLGIIKNLKQNDYWIPYSEGFVTDLRLGLRILKYADLSVNVKNVFNEEYMEVPGNTNSPRIYLLQLNAQF